MLVKHYSFITSSSSQTELDNFQDLYNSKDKLSGDKLSKDKLSGDKLSKDKLSGDKLLEDKLSEDKLFEDCS